MGRLPRRATATETAGLKCAPEIGASTVISTTKMAPVGSCCQEGEGAGVPGELPRHNAGTDHRGNQQTGAQSFGDQAAPQVESDHASSGPDPPQLAPGPPWM